MNGIDIALRVVDCLQRIFPNGGALHEPELGGNAQAYLNDCIASGFVSSVGAYVDRFEKSIAEFTGARHAVAVVNGTAGLHASMILAGVRPGDEVIVPALGFVAFANAVAYCGAAPHFIDSEGATLGLDPAKLRVQLESIADRRNDGVYNRYTGARIAGVICVHTFGNPVDLARIDELCREFGLPLIEDASESLGSYYMGQHTGTFGRLGVLSFNGNKIITTGGGGAILTNDPDLARRAKHITTTAKVAHPWDYEHDEVGFNYRMPNLNAALGCAQLELLPDFLLRKERLAAIYAAAFSGMEGVRLFSMPAHARPNHWLNAILIDGDRRVRDDLLRRCNESGFRIRGAWNPLHALPMYAHCPRGDLAVTEDLHARLICLPSSAFLTEQAVY
jgi:perosamine synthetase